MVVIFLLNVKKCMKLVAFCQLLIKRHVTLRQLPLYTATKIMPIVDLDVLQNVGNQTRG